MQYAQLYSHAGKRYEKVSKKSFICSTDFFNNSRIIRPGDIIKNSCSRKCIFLLGSFLATQQLPDVGNGYNDCGRWQIAWLEKVGAVDNRSLAPSYDGCKNLLVAATYGILRRNLFSHHVDINGIYCS